MTAITVLLSDYGQETFKNLSVVSATKAIFISRTRAGKVFYLQLKASGHIGAKYYSVSEKLSEKRDE